MKLIPNKNKDSRFCIELGSNVSLLDPDCIKLLSFISSKSNVHSVIRETIKWVNSSGVAEFNYFQTFKKIIPTITHPKYCFSIEGEKKYLRRKYTIELLQDIERSFLLGKRVKHGSKGITSLGGLSYFITTNRITTKGRYITVEVQKMSRYLCKNNPLYILASREVASFWNKTKIYFPNCIVIPHQLLKKDIFIIDPLYLTYHYKQGGNITLYKYSDFSDSENDVIVAEYSLEVRDEEKMGRIVIK